MPGNQCIVCASLYTDIGFCISIAWRDKHGTNIFSYNLNKREYQSSNSKINNFFLTNVLVSLEFSLLTQSSRRLMNVWIGFICPLIDVARLNSSIHADMFLIFMPIDHFHIKQISLWKWLNHKSKPIFKNKSFKLKKAYYLWNSLNLRLSHFFKINPVNVWFSTNSTRQLKIKPIFKFKPFWFNLSSKKFTWS